MAAQLALALPATRPAPLGVKTFQDWTWTYFRTRKAAEILEAELEAQQYFAYVEDLGSELYRVTEPPTVKPREFHAAYREAA